MSTASNVPTSYRPSCDTNTEVIFEGVYSDENCHCLLRDGDVIPAAIKHSWKQSHFGHRTTVALSTSVATNKPQWVR